MSAHNPTPASLLPDSPVGEQLAFYGLDDPQWMPLLLQCLQEGGCVLVERTGDLIILPKR